MSEEEFTNLSGLFSLYAFSPSPLDIEDLEENNNVASGAGCALPEGGSLRVDVSFPSPRDVQAGDRTSLKVTVVLHGRQVTVVNVGESTAVVVMPEIMSMMNNVIFSAGWAAPGSPVLQAFNSAIGRKEIDLLQDVGCLNNEVINFYLQMISECSETKDEWPSVYAFNTFFYGSLQSYGHCGVKRWTRKVDLFCYNLVLIPVHLGLHWCLAAVDFGRRKVSYYDSLGLSNSTCLDLICLYLEEERADKKGLL
jgi:hypothetical protein